jgi:hypothetical protein
MKRMLLLTTIGIAGASQLGNTNCGQITRDPGFDLWCGDQLCAWKVVRGDTERVATWHESDSGVALVGDDAAISQLTPVNSGDGNCIRFELVADVDDNADAYLDIDIEGDGRIERHERIPTSHWKPVSFDIATANIYDGIRFELGKRGPGRAAFARIDAHTRPAEDCVGLAPIASAKRPLGAACGDATDCMSNQCAASTARPLPPYWQDAWLGFNLVCVGCTAQTACGTNEVCGYNDPNAPILGAFAACVPTHVRALGDRCLVDDDCMSGMCQLGVCSACRIGAACRDGVCAAYGGGPAICASLEHRAQSGEPCGANADCASGTCNGGERRECEDGRSCINALQCPAGNDLIPGDCKTVGIEGGTCN